MIERLRATLRALDRLDPATLQSPALEPLRRDCADALRLGLDCRQLELSGSERDSLERLSELLEREELDGGGLAVAIHAATHAVDATPSTGR